MMWVSKTYAFWPSFFYINSELNLPKYNAIQCNVRIQARFQENLDVGSFSQRPKAGGGVWGRAPLCAAGENFLGC